MCEQNPYPVNGFRAGAKAIRYNVNIALSFLKRNELKEKSKGAYEPKAQTAAGAYPGFLSVKHA